MTPNRKIAGGLVAALAGGILIGTAAKPAEIVTVEVPYPSAVEVIVPSPYPSEVLVAEIPEACQLAIDALLNENVALLEQVISVYDAYLDYPDENLEEFGVRVEALLTSSTWTVDPDPILDDLSECDR